MSSLAIGHLKTAKTDIEAALKAVNSHFQKDQGLGKKVEEAAKKLDDNVKKMNTFFDKLEEKAKKLEQIPPLAFLKIVQAARKEFDGVEDAASAVTEAAAEPPSAL